MADIKQAAIAEIEQEIEFLNRIVVTGAESAIISRILAREQAALAELKRGMKGTQ